MKPFLYRHPKLLNFAKQQRQAFTDLSSALGKHHKVNIGAMPQWIIDEACIIHNQIDPSVNPAHLKYQQVSENHVPLTRIAKHYWRLVELCGPVPEYLILVPWLTRGGADLVTLNYCKALDSLGKKVVVISTLNEDSPWAEELPENVRFVELGKECARLCMEEQAFVLARLLVQMQPRVVHNINSALAYYTFVSYGKTISNFSKLYSQVFCIDVDESGSYAGYPVTYLPDCFEHLTALISENRTVLDTLKALYGFSEEKLFVNYQPISFDATPIAQEEIRNKAARDGIHVLWCNRIDRQKRPDVLLRVIEKCEALPFTFHIYGGALLDKDNYSKKLRKMNNVVFHGPYNGFYSLPFENFDVMLYTSQWDGIPTILFESMAIGLPIVASDVGGISEIIKDNDTGFLIDPFDDADKYVDALMKIHSDKNDLERIISNAIKFISTRHTQEIFIEDIKALPDYYIEM
jgi:glycosyltransferase involved in cell wall biosynthesis